MIRDSPFSSISVLSLARSGFLSSSLDVMTSCSCACNSGDSQKKGSPWITFITIRYRQKEEELSIELLDFIQGMINKNDILEILVTKSYCIDAFLVELPLPLCNSIGKILPQNEFDKLENTIKRLLKLKKTDGIYDHRMRLRETLNGVISPVELGHTTSLITIVRENLEYWIKLEK